MRVSPLKTRPALVLECFMCREFSFMFLFCFFFLLWIFSLPLSPRTQGGMVEEGGELLSALFLGSAVGRGGSFPGRPALRGACAWFDSTVAVLKVLIFE